MSKNLGQARISSRPLMRRYYFARDIEAFERSTLAEGSHERMIDMNIRLICSSHDKPLSLILHFKPATSSTPYTAYPSLNGLDLYVRSILLQLCIARVFAQLGVIIVVFTQLGAAKIDNRQCNRIVNLCYRTCDVRYNACISDQIWGGYCCRLIQKAG